MLLTPSATEEVPVALLKRPTATPLAPVASAFGPTATLLEPVSVPPPALYAETCPTPTAPTIAKPANTLARTFFLPPLFLATSDTTT